jgi:hypothetical protein
VHLSNNRGTGIIERIVAGVPIRRASGTRDPEIFDKINDMLDEFDEAGRDDLARMIADKKILAVALWNSFRRKGLSLKLTPQSAISLTTALAEWLKGAELADKTKEDYAYALEGLLQGNPTIAELPDLLRRYRQKARPRMFNLTRSAAQSFVRDVVPGGRYSELWIQVSALRTKAVRRRPGNPQPPERARAIAEALGIYGQTWWTLCCTGMGWKEYTQDGFEVKPDRVIIHGEKRDDRDRMVPRICTPVRPMCHERTFAAKLTAAAVLLGLGRLTIYDGRRTFRLFLEGAGIPKSAREAYMGHAAGDMDELYGQLGDHTLDYYLPAHREKLLAFVGAEPQWLRALA